MKPDLPTHDENTGKLLLTKDQLEDGAYYVGRCRNASVARWNAEEGQFYHWREKFGRVYIETIKHPIDEEQFDVFRPIYKLSSAPFAIPFDDTAEFDQDLAALNKHNLEVWCKCNLQGTCIHCKSHEKFGH